MSRQSGRLGAGRRRCDSSRFVALAVACLVLATLPLAACSSAAPDASPQGFSGHDWQVVTISHDGTTESIPARLHVVLRFSPDGQFGANDSVNFLSGAYRTSAGGFTVGGMRTTLVGYVGHDPIILLAINAIGSFNDGVHATATLTGNRLVVGVGSYTLTCQRLGRLV